MSTCKFCGESIEWREADGRKVPTDPVSGKRHECMKGPNAAPAASKTGAQVFEGKILSINTEKRALALDGGAILLWADYQDQALARFRNGYRVRVEHDGEKLLSILSTFTPGSAPTGGGKSFGKPPRNDRIIVAQSMMKCYTDLYIASIPKDGHIADFACARATILAAVEEDVEKIMTIGGVLV